MGSCLRFRPQSTYWHPLNRFLTQQNFSCLPTCDQEFSNWATPRSEEHWEHSLGLFESPLPKVWFMRKNGKSGGQLSDSYPVYHLQTLSDGLNHNSTKNHSSSQCSPLIAHSRNKSLSEQCTTYFHTSRAPGRQALRILGHRALLILSPTLYCAVVFPVSQD